MDAADEIGPRQRQEIVIPEQGARVVPEPLAAEVCLDQAEALQLRAHRSIENQDAIGEQRLREWTSRTRRSQLNHK